MADDGITNLSEIDWDHIDMHPCHGMEGYEPRPEYSVMVQERKRYKAVMGLQLFRAAVKLFVVLGACLLMKTMLDYANDIRGGIIEPPTYNELAFIVYLLLGMVTMLGLLMMARKLRQIKYGCGHHNHTAPASVCLTSITNHQPGAVTRPCAGIVSSFHRVVILHMDADDLPV